MIITGIQYIEFLLYAYLVLSVGYLVLFAVASWFADSKEYPTTDVFHRFLILIPGYKEDKVILDTVRAALNQRYPAGHYQVLVISDRMLETTNTLLRSTGADVLEIHYEESSKAKALQAAIRHLSCTSKKGRIADYVVILDADNLVSSDYLEQVNRYLQAIPCQALQTHRTAKNLNTTTAVLDAAIEEMNNTLFRLGHVQLGLSSALIGSGMVLSYPWFAENIFHTHTAGEDKELEELLLRQRIRIHYADSIRVLDEKVQHKEVLRNQRRRWIATQFFMTGLMWPRVPQALCNRNWDYVVKAIQSIILPRSILMGIICLMAVITTVIPFLSYTKWWGLLGVLLITLYTAIPQNMRNKRLYQALKEVPFFVITMIRNLFA
ncbi:MAG: glycosyltransferase, partial [Bacteroidaceae bacterium]|nr:glycosyltransferase [Bacteroidaceae bacterium]